MSVYGVCVECVWSVCESVCERLWECVSVYKCQSMWVCVSVWMSVCASVSVCVSVCKCMSVSECLCVCVCVSVCGSQELYCVFSSLFSFTFFGSRVSLQLLLTSRLQWCQWPPRSLLLTPHLPVCHARETDTADLTPCAHLGTAGILMTKPPFYLCCPYFNMLISIYILSGEHSIFGSFLIELFKFLLSFENLCIFKEDTYGL